MNHVETLDVEIIRVKVKKLLSQNHFSICDVDAMLRLTGGVPDKKTYDRLHALHCVDYREMSTALRLEIPRMLQLVLEAPPIHYLYQPPAVTTERLLN